MLFLHWVDALLCYILWNADHKPHASIDLIGCVVVLNDT